MTLEERMESGKLYDGASEELQAKQRIFNELVYDFNATRPSEVEKRLELLRQLFAEVGEGCWIEPPLRANWGSHTHLGNHVYANFNLTLVDDTHVYIGDHVMIGPNVTITAAGHPIEPSLRWDAAQYNFPVRIEDRRGGHHPPWGDHWEKLGDRRGQRCDERYSPKRSGCRGAMPRAAGDWPQRQRILFPRPPNRRWLEIGPPAAETFYNTFFTPQEACL